MEQLIMRFYIKLKHEQFRLKREKYLPYVLSIALAVLAILFFLEAVNTALEPRIITIINEVGAKGQEIEKNAPIPTTRALDDSIEGKIRREFGVEGEIALAVFKAESRLKNDAINYNCEGYPNGICPKGLEHKAWSVDCGIAQINTLGKTCPKELFDPEVNIKKAKEMHSKRGFQPWYTFKDGVYKKYLTTNL